MALKFSDGMVIETDGEYRVISKSDGLYVVGKGWCIPVSTYEEGNDIVRELKEPK